MNHNLRFALILALVLLIVPATLIAQASLTSATLDETKLTQLPSGALVWRLETFPDKAAAEAAATDTGLVIESGGQIFLATLGPAGGSTAGGTLVTEIGPLSIPNASEYLLRAVELSGPSGSQAGAHTHPGAEAYYVAAGTLTVHSQTGDESASAGEAMVGPSAGMVMQPKSTGSEPLRALALFAVDSSQPFSSPVQLDMPGMPDTGAGGTSTESNRFSWIFAAFAGMALVGGGLALRRRRAVV
jgi:quercetin dioxygenase-like cupin family protein